MGEILAPDAPWLDGLLNQPASDGKAFLRAQIDDRLNWEDKGYWFCGAVRGLRMSVSHWPETPTELKAADTPAGSLWRFTVDQYHQMLRAGILTEDDPVELLEGWLVAKMTKNPAYRAATRLRRTALEGIFISGWYVDSQEPVTLHDSEPEPDVAVVREQTRDYLDRHPGASDLALVVEIAEASLERDRGSKLRVYARARIPAYWIVNLIERRIEVYSDPLSKAVPASYGRRSDFGEADSVSVVVEGTEIGRIAVRDVLP